MYSIHATVRRRPHSCPYVQSWWDTSTDAFFITLAQEDAHKTDICFPLKHSIGYLIFIPKWPSLATGVLACSNQIVPHKDKQPHVIYFYQQGMILLAVGSELDHILHFYVYFRAPLTFTWWNIVTSLWLNELFFLLKKKKKVHYKERHQSRAAQWLSIVVKEVKMMTNTYFDTKRNRNMINDSVQRDNTSMLNGLCFVFFLFNKTAAIHNGDKWCKAGNPIL